MLMVGFETWATAPSRSGHRKWEGICHLWRRNQHPLSSLLSSEFTSSALDRPFHLAKGFGGQPSSSVSHSLRNGFVTEWGPLAPK